MLFNPESHVPRSSLPWCQDTAYKTINAIFEMILSMQLSNGMWAAHPDEEVDIEFSKTVYNGAMGTLWALDQMAQYLGRELPFDKVELAKTYYQDYLKDPDTKEVVPSLLLGEVGVLLVIYKFSPDHEVEERLYQAIESNIENPVMEALWAAPGTMIGAAYMYQWTKEKKWATLFKQNVRFLVDKLKAEEAKGELVWQQDLYGSLRRLIGAGHGYFGNIFGIYKEPSLISEEDRDYLQRQVLKVLKASAKVEDDKANFWVGFPTEENGRVLTQWCHGAPGIVTSLRNFPSSPELNSYLEKAANLTWEAGPLKKGVGICHGTDGNGYPFLQLYRRLGEAKWLEKARAFAMKAIEQRNGRPTLFTGEAGLALYLIDCIEENQDFPFLDFI